MRPINLTTSGTSVSAVAVLDAHKTPFNIGFGVIVTGAVTFTVQHTFDDPFLSTFDPSTATWFNHPNATGLTVSADGNYAFPVRAIRVNQTAGAGSTAGVVLQAGI